MASRFVEADEEFIEELKNTSENKNTKRSTGYWTNIFQQWARTRGKNEQLESYEVPQLNEALAQFFAELRKGSGKEYEPDSLKGNASSFRSPFKKQKLSQVYREKYRVPVVKKSLRRKGKEATRAWDGETAEQSPKPD